MFYIFCFPCCTENVPNCDPTPEVYTQPENFAYLYTPN